MNVLSATRRPQPLLRFAASILLAVATLLTQAEIQAASHWPQFRGPSASGVSADPVPVRWNIDSGENIRWQTSIPGLGHASPIVWEERIYVATALNPGGKAELKMGRYGEGNSCPEKEPHQWRLLCLETSTGKVLWDKLGHQAIPRLERHTKATQVQFNPATDGKHIAAIFGSEGPFLL